MNDVSELLGMLHGCNPDEWRYVMSGYFGDVHALLYDSDDARDSIDAADRTADYMNAIALSVLDGFFPIDEDYNYRPLTRECREEFMVTPMTPYHFKHGDLFDHLPGVILRDPDTIPF